MRARLHVDFTDGAHWTTAAVLVIPLVLTARPHHHAALIAPVVTRLARVPVGVRHLSYCVIAGRHHSPDEFRCRARSWIYTLSRRPETDAIFPLRVAVIQ